MTSTHFAMGALIGMFIIQGGWWIHNYVTRPKKLSFRDYYDVYFGHCRNCRIPE